MATTPLTLDQLRTAGLGDVDPEVAALLERELERQRGEIELIASENFTWRAMLEAVGSVPTNKYSEGYPGRRYYGGCEIVDEIEQLAIDRAKALFGAEHANVQPHAGAQTNMAVYFAVLQPGDTILSLELSHGGHLTHGLKVNFSGRLYDIVHYGVSRETNLVDYDDVLALAKEHGPKLIVCGGSAYPRTVETWRFREIADEVGALLLCDMAHFAGLVAAGLHPSPVEHCDFVTSTTHKTLAGPRSGFVLCREEHAQAVDRAVFPGMQGGPLNHVIAAKAACFKIAASEPFREYQTAVRANADALAESLQEGGLDVLTGGTDSRSRPRPMTRNPRVRTEFGESYPACPCRRTALAWAAFASSPWCRRSWSAAPSPCWRSSFRRCSAACWCCFVKWAAFITLFSINSTLSPCTASSAARFAGPGWASRRRSSSSWEASRSFASCGPGDGKSPMFRSGPLQWRRRSTRRTWCWACSAHCCSL